MINLLTFSARQHLVDYIDKTISTINPAVQLDGSDIDSAPPLCVDPHICNVAYADVEDVHQDLIDLIATCQRHTRCSPSYCLRTVHGEQKCRFDYPKPLQMATTLEVEDGELELHTARNDGLINSHNPIQLSGWRANVDQKFVVSRRKLIEYILCQVCHQVRATVSAPQGHLRCHCQEPQG